MRIAIAESDNVSLTEFVAKDFNTITSQNKFKATHNDKIDAQGKIKIISSKPINSGIL
jgi:hypothetical protein